MLEKPASQRFETLQLHAGSVQCSNPWVKPNADMVRHRAFPDALNSCAVPIYTTAAFAFNNAEHGVRLLNISEFGNIYSRITNVMTNNFRFDDEMQLADQAFSPLS
jgi:O-acetylhomoserine/O-acetylserine sulfhydrylase-like pyridoxal-dependent enzyme